MANHVAVTYDIAPTGPSAADVAASMQNPLVLGGPGVPVPYDTLTALGLWVLSDVTAGTTRTLSMSLVPSATATATVTVSGAGEVTAIPVTAPGDNYVQPPIPVFVAPAGRKNFVTPKGRALLNVQGTSQQYVGSGYHAGTVVAFIGGLPPALFLNPQDSKYAADKTGYPTPNGPPYAVNSLSVVKKGRGYTTNSFIEFQGGELAPGGHHAKAVIAQLGTNGEILGVLLIDPGEGYVVPPNPVVIEPSGSPAQTGNAAKLVVNMGAGTPATATGVTLDINGGITAINGLTPGDGYVQPPTIVFYDSNVAPGTGAAFRATMGVSRIDVLNRGQGVAPGTTVTLLPFFKSIYPDTSDQKTPFYNFPLLFAIRQMTASQVRPGTPLLT